MNPEVGQIWWLLYRKQYKMCPALLVSSTSYDELCEKAIKYECINLETGLSFVAWNTRWTDPVLSSLIGTRIA
jgi:hypothetical protein